MKVLMVNNQLYVLGGSETYMFSVGDELAKRGNNIQYFGLEDPNHIHGNEYGIYATKSLTPFSFISNRKNIKRFASLLDQFQPDIIHMNLIYYTLTEDIVYEAKQRNIPIVQTIHDSKIVCPCHRFYIEHKGIACRECLDDSSFSKCIKNRCIKGSMIKSKIAQLEAKYYKNKETYSLIDKYVFVCNFMKEQHIGHGVKEEQSTVLYNFSRIMKRSSILKSEERYVLYFGRIGREKGMEVLAEVCRRTPDIHYKFVGSGDMEYLFYGLKNCELLGFKSGKELEDIIGGAVCSVLPSIWYENCPMTVLESIALGTPVIGANIGGIPELIKMGETGFLFESGNVFQLEERIKLIFFNKALASKMAIQCINDNCLLSVQEYVDKLEQIYRSI